LVVLVLDPQQRRWMDGDDKLGTVCQLDRRAAHFGNGHGFAGEAARGGDSERDDGRRLDQVALAFEPDLAALDLVIVGPLVQPPLAAHLVLEMLDRVGDESVFPRDAGVFKGGVENAPGRPYEWLSRQVLFVAGLFADQHEIGLLRTFARHRLVGVAIERTSLALGLSRRQRAQGFDGFAAFLIHGLIHREEFPTAVNVQNRGIKVSLCLLPSRALARGDVERSKLHSQILGGQFFYGSLTSLKLSRRQNKLGSASAVLLLSEPCARAGTGLDERDLSAVGGGAGHHDRDAGELVSTVLLAQIDDGPAGLCRRKMWPAVHELSLVA
jgi:hypothetical protein